MPPKQQRVTVQPASNGRAGPAFTSGYLGGAYRELTAPENASVVRSVAIFGVAVAFLHSGLREFLLPP
ncbi:MAG: hypothetical protein M1832_001007 [Thelocarpon impressellum]|nr:MAG: hypothetical protein M1832_001007 [Thelocarpon impressellum]